MRTKRTPGSKKGDDRRAILSLKPGDVTVDAGALPLPARGEIDVTGGSVVLQALWRSQHKAAAEWEEALGEMVKHAPRLRMGSVVAFSRASGRLHVIHERIKILSAPGVKDLLRSVEGQVECLVEEVHRAREKKPAEA